MDFSILIPTMHSRNSLFQKVLAEVNRQINEIHNKQNILSYLNIKNPKFEVLYEVDNGELTLGAKRNLLVSRAKGKYCCFIDDDDVIAPFYLKTFIPMIYGDYDCASFLGVYYYRGDQNNPFDKPFYHSLDIKEWGETSDRYLRSVSPMNMIKTDIVRKVQYKDIRNTEDHEFSIRLINSGLLKKEFKIPYIPIYHYIDGVKHNRETWKYRWIDNYRKIELFNDETPT
jgi:glycosyltransferase involved in cell wall biosynthesis